MLVYPSNAVSRKQIRKKKHLYERVGMIVLVSGEMVVKSALVNENTTCMQLERVDDRPADKYDGAAGV